MGGVPSWRFQQPKDRSSGPPRYIPPGGRRDAFRRRVLGNSNALQAAIWVGYLTKTARQQGSRMLTNVDIQAEIEQMSTSQLAEVSQRVKTVNAKVVRTQRLKPLPAGYSEAL